MKQACGMSRFPAFSLMREENDCGLSQSCGSVSDSGGARRLLRQPRAQEKRGRLCYGLRHDRLVAGKCEGRFC